MQSKLLIITLLVLVIAGCASTRHSSGELQIQQLRAEIDSLKNQIQQKDDEIDSLQWRLQDTKKQGVIYTKKEKNYQAPDVTAKMTTRNIQLALKKAGFYQGDIDGKVGKATTKAIREFQKSNGLNADGIIGKQTWSKLRQYLD